MISTRNLPSVSVLKRSWTQDVRSSRRFSDGLKRATRENSTPWCSASRARLWTHLRNRTWYWCAWELDCVHESCLPTLSPLFRHGISSIPHIRTRFLSFHWPSEQFRNDLQNRIRIGLWTRVLEVFPFLLLTEKDLNLHNNYQFCS